MTTTRGRVTARPWTISALPAGSPRLWNASTGRRRTGAWSSSRIASTCAFGFVRILFDIAGLEARVSLRAVGSPQADHVSPLLVDVRSVVVWCGESSVRGGPYARDLFLRRRCHGCGVA